MKKIIIIASKPGQLGNLLALYSHFIAYSLEHDYHLFTPAFHKYERLFKGTSRGWVGSLLSRFGYQISFYFARAIKKLHLNSSLVQAIYLDWNEAVDLDTVAFESRVTFVQGWLYRGSKIIKKHQAYIRTYLTPLPRYAKPVKVYREQFNRDRVIVGVHIRHGDYNTFENGKYFYSHEQYLALMQSITRLFDKPVYFLICSNAPMDETKMTGFEYQKGPGSPLGDLYALAACQYIIGPPSTFTSWASFYGRVPLYHIYSPDAPYNLSNFQVLETP